MLAVQAFRCLKPGGKMIVSFGTKNKMAEDKQVKVSSRPRQDRSSDRVRGYSFGAAPQRSRTWGGRDQEYLDSL